MKWSKFSALALFGILLFSACGPDEIGDPVVSYSPVLMKREDLEKSVKVTDARTLNNPGKIYHYGNYLLVNERFEGIHIIDNSDPSNPVNKKFVAVPGCLDMAVKDDVMYVDNAVDLVSISITNPENIEILDRKKNVFPDLVPPNSVSVPTKYDASHRPENTFIIAWK